MNLESKSDNKVSLNTQISNTKVFVGLDIGTTKIVCLVGRKNEHGKLEVLGYGKSKSLGVNVAKNRLFMEYENVEFIVGDIFETFKKEYETTDLFINTSCEHMRPMSEWGPKGPRSLYKDSPFGEPVTRKVPWWTRMKEGCHFAFQSNDMVNIDTHINCVNNGDEFKTQLPTNTEVLVEDEINDERGTRFTLIGKIL
jgi:hypothetical protein